MSDQGQVAMVGGLGMQIPRAITEQLRQKKASIESDLADVNAAIAALEVAPEVALAFDKVARALGNRF